jgi:hypothetical protein
MDLTGLTKEDTQAILDGLAALPLMKTYNTFNKVLQQVQAADRAEGIPTPVALPGPPAVTAVVPGEEANKQS